jgi:translation initiation factor IF-1
MAGTDAFEVEGLVLEALANGTYRLELANGHRLLGFVAGRASGAHERFAPGDTVKLNLTPYDLSSGRIVVERTAE